MIQNIMQNKRLRSSSNADGDPAGVFTVALEKIYRVHGLGMYRVLRASPSRDRLLRLAGRVEQAWQRAERTGRWDGFARSVDRLAWGWLEMLEGDARPLEGKKRRSATPA